MKSIQEKLTFDDILLSANPSETLTKNEILHCGRLATIKEFEQDKEQQLRIATASSKTAFSKPKLYQNQSYKPYRKMNMGPLRKRLTIPPVLEEAHFLSSERTVSRSRDEPSHWEMQRRISSWV
jgi:hypothetical protein